MNKTEEWFVFIIGTLYCFYIGYLILCLMFGINIIEDMKNTIRFFNKKEK